MSDIIASDREHARLSPSDAKRWMNCMASIEMVERISARPDADMLLLPESSEYADEGSKAHEIAGFMLEARNLPDKLTEEGLGVLDEAAAVSPDMYRHGEEFCDYIEGLLRPGSQLMVENRVTYDQWAPGNFGTSDVVVIAEDGLDIIDYKYGAGILVDAKRNPQLQTYALGVLETFDLFLPDAQRVTLHVYQPRREHYDSWETTVDELLEFGESVAYAAQTIQSGEAWEKRLFEPGDACLWCRAKPACRPLQDKLANEAIEGFDVIDGDPMPKNVDLIPISDLAAGSKIAGLVNQWANALNARIADVLLSGGKVPGKKLVRGRSIRRWAVDKRADSALARLGLKANVRYKERQLISVKQAEDKAKSGLIDRQDFERIMAKHIFKPEGALQVADDSARSRAVEPPNADDGFTVDENAKTKGEQS